MAPVRYGRAGAVFPEFQFLLCARAKGQEHRAGTEIEREGRDGTEREQNSGSEIQQCDKGKPVGIFFPDSVLRNLCYFSADSAGIYDLQQLL